MIRLPDEKSCFLSNSTDYVPKPADLVKLLVSARRYRRGWGGGGGGGGREKRRGQKGRNACYKNRAIRITPTDFRVIEL